MLSPSILCKFACLPLFTLAFVNLARGQDADAAGFKKVVQPFLQKHCVECHGPKQAKGKLTLHDLAAVGVEKSQARWRAVLERIESGDMPPPERPQPSMAEIQGVVDWIEARLDAGSGEHAFVSKANAIRHEALFGVKAASPEPSSARLWRISPFVHRGIIDDLTGGPIILHSREVRGVENPFIRTPIVLGETKNFRDYAVTGSLDESLLEQMAQTGRKTLELMVASRNEPPFKVLKNTIDGQNVMGASGSPPSRTWRTPKASLPASSCTAA